jgi:hypothetical protein
MSDRTSPETETLRQVLGAFYKTFDVMTSARNSEAKNMNVWADDMKAVEDVVLFLEHLRDGGGSEATLWDISQRVDKIIREYMPKTDGYITDAESRIMGILNDLAHDVCEEIITPTAGLAQTPDQWRCFHCSEVFTDAKAAANHFGVDHLGDETLCQMAQVDGGIARVIADLSEELQRYRSEDNESFREFYRLGADHSQALIREEQKGYDRGLADGRTVSDTSTDRGGA